MVDVEQRPLWRRRLRKVARFVAIVWGLAGAFLGLQYVQLLLLGAAIERGAIDPDMVIQSVPENAACGHVVAALEPAVLDAGGVARTRRLAFDLGLDLGFEAGADHLRKAGGEAVPEPPRARQQLAAELDVPVPEIPEVQRRANMFQEYSNHLAADPQCIAARLARVYSPGHAALFRLGAVVAPSVSYRRLGLTDPTFGAEIRHYGESAGAPQDLLAPLMQTSDRRDLESVRQEAEEALDRLEEWVARSGSREGAGGPPVGVDP